MMNYILIGIMAILAGCATMDPAVQVTNTVIPDAAATSTAQTPAQLAIAALEKFANNPIFTLAVADSQRTLARVDSWKGQITPLADFAARECPTAIILGAQDLQTNVATAKALLTDFDIQATALLSGKFTGIIEPLTVAKWGPKGTPGADPRAAINDIRDNFLNRVRTIQRACANLIPDTLMRDLLEQAGGIAIK